MWTAFLAKQEDHRDMIVYLRTSLFESPAQTLVNTVNIEGVMGKGIAKEFKLRFPNMFREYAQLCRDGKLKIGTLHLWRGCDAWVLNFPTKTTWRRPSKIDFIISGLDKFCRTYDAMGISSVSFPPLGCGNGQLDWEEVRPVMEQYLKNLPIKIYIHDRQVSPDFVPEHMEGISYEIPGSFDRYLYDIGVVLFRNQGVFYTLREGNQIKAIKDDQDNIKITAGKKSYTIPVEDIELSWLVLQSGILSYEQYGSEHARRVKSYLFAILANLPYIHATEIETVRDGKRILGHGLILERDRSEFETLQEAGTQQPTLWQSL